MSLVDLLMEAAMDWREAWFSAVVASFQCNLFRKECSTGKSLLRVYRADVYKRQVYK